MQRMVRSGSRWRSVVEMAAGFLAALMAASVSAQTALPTYDPASIALLAFRPGAADTLLLARTDTDGRLQADLVRLTNGGHAELIRTLPGTFTSVAWLDPTHIVTGSEDGKLENWPIEGGEPSMLITLGEPIVGIGVAPTSRNLALRLTQTLRLVAADGRPNGPTITLGPASRSDDSCSQDGAEHVPAFSPDERLLAFSSLCGDLRVVGQDGTRLMQPALQHPYVRRHVFSSDGRGLVVAYAPPGGADVVPVAPGRLGNPHALEAAENLLDVAALPDKQGLIVLSADRVRFLDADGNLRHDDVAPAGSTRVAVATDGSRVAIAATEGLVLLDGDGQPLARPFSDFGLPVTMRAIAGGTQMAALHTDGRLRVWQLDGTERGTALRLWKSDPSAASASAQSPRLFVSPTGRKVGVLAPDGQFEVLDQNWNRIGRAMRFPAGPNDTLLSATLLLDDRILRPMPDGSGFLVLDLEGRVLGRLAFGDQEKLIPEAAAAASNVIAIYTSDGRLAAWTREGRPIRQHKLAALNLTSPALDISADGKLVVLHDAPANLPPHLLIWRPGGEDSLESRDGSFAGLLADGSLLRISGGQLVLDAPDGAQRLSLPFDGDRVVGVTPDGKVALVDKKGRVHAIALVPGQP